MGKTEKLLEKAKRNAKNLPFDELCALAVGFGFIHDRTKGSHRIYTRDGWTGILDFQPREDGSAKPYQVRQLLDALRDLGLIGE
jgi:predicted RNA binding protein YcfA (HicA-like mRNA interferase family)